MNPRDIRQLREAMGMTQEAFAKALRVSFPTVNRWENGKNEPQREQVLRMAEMRDNLAAAAGAGPVPLTFERLVDYWTGRLAIAIGAGSFRAEVGAMLGEVMKDAYERGQRREERIG